MQMPREREPSPHAYARSKLQTRADGVLAKWFWIIVIIWMSPACGNTVCFCDKTSVKEIKDKKRQGFLASRKQFLKYRHKIIVLVCKCSRYSCVINGNKKKIQALLCSDSAFIYFSGTFCISFFFLEREQSLQSNIIWSNNKINEGFWWLVYLIL